MLKHTLVRAALARSGDAAMDRNNRKRYGAWLAALFPQEDKPTPTVQLSGCVISVMLRRATAGVEENLASSYWPLLHRALGERDVEELLAWEAGPLSNLSPTITANEAELEINLETKVVYAIQDAKPVVPVVPKAWTPKQPTSMATRTTTGATVPTTQLAEPDKEWPPAVNQLGMIGQGS